MTEDQYIRNELLCKYCNSPKKDRVGEFATFEGFYQWAMRNGYESGKTMLRRDSEKPVSPENCYFVEGERKEPFSGEERIDWNRRWTATVNRIRKAWGMPLLPDPVTEEKKKADRPMLMIPVSKKNLRKIANREMKENYREMKPYWTSRLKNLFDEDGPWYVRFRAGNCKDDPYVECQVDLKVGQGRPEWGAAPGVEYYILDILKISKACIPEDWQKK